MPDPEDYESEVGLFLVVSGVLVALAAIVGLVGQILWG